MTDIEVLRPSTPLVRTAPLRAPVLSTRQLSRIQAEAAMISKSSLIPAALRGKPAEIVTVAIKGHAFGLDMASSLEQIYVVDGKPCTSAKLCGALAAKSGVWMAVEESSATLCTVVGTKPGDPAGFLRRITWTIEEARTAGLTGKDVWKKYPAAMLRARSVKAWVTAHAPEALMGWHDDDVPLEELLGYDDESSFDDAAQTFASNEVESVLSPGQILHNALETVAVSDHPGAAALRAELRSMAEERGLRLHATDFDANPEWAAQVEAAIKCAVRSLTASSKAA